jgi:hypothetical protein
MIRKTMIALAAVAALGTAFVATEASARSGGHGFGGHHGFSGGGFRHHGFHRGFFGSGFGFYGYPYSAYYGYDGCYQVRRVPTPWGWRWRRVWVCG